MLTNGLEWRFYLPREAGDVRDRVFAEVDLNRGSAPAARVFVEFLESGRVISGAAVEAAGEALTVYRDQRRAADILPGVWTQMRAEPARALVRLVSKQVEQAAGCVPRVEDVVEVIRSAHPQVEDNDSNDQ